MKDEDEEKIDQHESYGMIGINRVSGGTYLFGSEAQHHSFIRIEVRRAEMRRSLSNDWPCANSLPLIVVDLSHTQFGTLITSPGIGNGVTCTIRSINGKQMKECPAPKQITSKFGEDLKVTMARAVGVLDGLTVQLTKALLPGEKPLNKKELNVLLEGIRHAVMEVKSNIPFVEESFNEEMEKKVDHAITELEGVRDHMIQQVGLRALAEKINPEKELPEFSFGSSPLLGDGKKEK